MIIKNLLILLFISISLAACGRRGALEPLEPSGYPHYYPMPVTESFGENNPISIEGNVLSDSASVSEITDYTKQNRLNAQDLNSQLGLPQYENSNFKPEF